MRTYWRELTMTKRKNDELFPLWGTADWLYIGFLVAGMALLSVISVSATWNWMAQGRWWIGQGRDTTAPVPTQPIIAAAPLQMVPRDSVAFAALEQAPYVWVGVRDDAHLSTKSGYHAFNMPADAVALSPDGYTLAVLHNGGVSIRLPDRTIHAIAAPSARHMAWDLSGARLYIATHDSLYRYDVAASQLQPVLHGVALVAPPVSNPATGRILIAEINADQTTLRSMDARCATPQCAENSFRLIASVPFFVTWADYHPSATAILLTAAGSPHLILLRTGNGQVETLTTAHPFPRQAMFSPNGQFLAYVDQQDRLMMANVQTPDVTGAALFDVRAFAWARQ